MADKKTAPLLLNVDASEVLIQTGELLKLLELPASFFQGIPEHVVDLFFDRVRGLIDNIVLSDFATTVSTTDGEVSDESDIHSIMLEKSAKAESKAPQASHKGR